jgi:hypothetical protein
VTIHLTGGTELARRQPRHVTHENLHVAIGDVFRAARRQLTMRGVRPALARSLPSEARAGRW